MLHRPFSVIAASVCAALALLSVAGSARAEDAALRVAAEVQGESLFQQSGAVGLVLAVVRGENTAIAGFGETTKGNGRKPDGRTIVRIGSISKAMTGQLLGDLVADGTVRLADPVQKLLPPGRTAPGFGGRPITLLDLATHTAGFLRDYEPGADFKPVGNPCPYLTSERYLDYLQKYRLPYAPGRVASYSNFGFGLLGWLLGNAAGSSYAALLAERLARPFEMPDTVTELRPDQRDRFMTGYEQDNTPAEPWDGSEIMQGSGGVFSTGADMARWIRANLAAGAGPRAEARALAQAICRTRQSLDAVIALDGSLPLGGLGLGWEINFPTERTLLLIQKTGGFSGFLSYVVFVPGRGVGAFVVFNRLDLGAMTKVIDGTNGLLTALAPR
jgi:D-alanyl-D-alanine-carboxypeptidase/D-alanyl-D-alanine-endopeptidase